MLTQKLKRIVFSSRKHFEVRSASAEQIQILQKRAIQLSGLLICTQEKAAESEQRNRPNSM